MITEYHSKYFAFELTKRCPSDSIEKLAGALVDAQVDLNPHQVEAALFAFQSPLSKGALLADEVGLGKTIEAGMVLSQKWAEKKRRILIIVPSNLRKQWHQELQEKFFLSGTILESRSYNREIKNGNRSPFEVQDSIVICSYHFARNKAEDINRIRWDLVVIDEAHRLRNVYKPSNVIANTLKEALKNFPKLLLTATPLQNSLLELYGLVSIIDEQTFGDLKSFREQFANLSDPRNFEILKSRLKPVCHRTLRRQVTSYVSYTERHPMLQTFEPSESEDRLYNLVSDYLCRENLQALPSSQRSLMTLVLRKLLASSSFAIAGALNTLTCRLEKQLEMAQPPEESLGEELDKDYEALDETADEWTEDGSNAEPLSDLDRKALENEIADLKSFHDLAVSIKINKKGEALLKALEQAFKDRSPENKKAIIFTESRRTQDYILRTLSDSPYKDGIVLFNGSNSDPKSREIYTEWFERHKDTDKVTGSRTADMRSALVDYFREKGQIMIATEAGAEGINLQFCSLVVNYDLPWNPQRIEQRIGRCHRYGQKNDVVVVNFLNQKNEAEVRVFQLLSEKFSLFQGVFGASDEVLGAIESGVDFEKRISAIYQRCRTPEEIKASFDQLQQELSAQINDSIKKTRQQLLENFDAEVHEKLRINMANSREYLNRYEQNLMLLTQFELNGNAEFHDGLNAFTLKSNPFQGINDNVPLGRYELPRRSGEAHLYRLGHPLAEQVLSQAKERPLPPAEITLDYASGPKITALEPFLGQSGELAVSLFTIESLGQAEDHLIFAAMADNGQVVDEDLARRLLSLPACSVQPINVSDGDKPLNDLSEKKKAEIRRGISERNARFFELEAEKLDNWAEDLKVTLEREIKDIDRQIREAKRAAKAALTLEEKLAGQKQIKALESTRNSKRRALFEAQDEIDARREKLIEEIEGKLQQKTSESEIFKIRWRLV
ncbi:DEAD/DEAH box helicase [Candidatus Nitromaritima sp. SCGC AAA799-A02]|nr:DEAD/DEAH box helicase [Candidatus Nitromaritima sp. SCGC AAA799-A02]